MKEEEDLASELAGIVSQDPLILAALEIFEGSEIAEIRIALEKLEKEKKE